jgi:ketosteroid isomerase-like protein
MKKIHFPAFTATAVAILMIIGCKDSDPAKEKTASSATTTETTNPVMSIASSEYSELAEKSLQHFANLDYDAWGNTLADDVIYTFPDGDVDTRTKLEGKAANMAWWKSWRASSGIESMTLTEFNHTPVSHAGPLKAGALPGVYDIVYFSNKLVYGGKPVAVRMNFAIHFNADKKIDRIVTYYDRSLIIKATGKNILEEKPVK